jgi:hypothetical protein
MGINRKPAGPRPYVRGSMSCQVESDPRMTMRSPTRSYPLKSRIQTADLDPNWNCQVIAQVDGSRLIRVSGVAAGSGYIPATPPGFIRESASCLTSPFSNNVEFTVVDREIDQSVAEAYPEIRLYNPDTYPVADWTDEDGNYRYNTPRKSPKPTRIFIGNLPGSHVQLLAQDLAVSANQMQMDLIMFAKETGCDTDNAIVKVPMVLVAVARPAFFSQSRDHDSPRMVQSILKSKSKPIRDTEYWIECDGICCKIEPVDFPKWDEPPAKIHYPDNGVSSEEIRCIADAFDAISGESVTIPRITDEPAKPRRNWFRRLIRI